jgi:hypothetical protein
MLPVLLAATTTIASVLLLVVALGADRNPAEVPPGSFAGWVLGAAGGLILPRFRLKDGERSSDPNYTIQRWRPDAVVAGLVVVGIVACVAHAWLVAGAVARA